MKLCLVLLLASVLTAGAHPLLQNAMWVVFAPDRVRVAVNTSLREILVAQQVKEDDTSAIDAAATKHGGYVVQHLALRVGAQELAGRVVKVTPPVLFSGEPEQTFYQYELEYPFPPGPPPASVGFSHTMLREWPYSPGHPWDVTYVVRLKRSDQPEVNSALLHADERRDLPTGWTAQDGRVASPQSAAVRSRFADWRLWIIAAALLLAIAGFAARARR